MNQKQRDYFVERVESLCKDRINTLKATSATEIQRIANEKYNEFVCELNLDNEMGKIKAAEDVLANLVPQVKSILNSIKDLRTTKSNHPYSDNGVGYYQSSNAYSTFTEYLMDCCESVSKKEFYKTDAGKEIKALEDYKSKAIDTIMMDGSKVTELTVKLNNILSNCNLQLSI